MRKMQFIIYLSFLFILTGCTEKQNHNYSIIRYALFDVNSYRTSLKDEPSIAVYYEIDSNGIMKIVRDEENNGQYQSSTAKLLPEQVEYIKSFFQDKNRLVNFVKEYTFEKDTEFFAGSYEYYYVTYMCGIKDSICTIGPFMSDKLLELNNMLSTIYYSDSTIKTDSIIQPSPIFVKSLFNAFLTNKKLPPISTLSPF